MMNRFEKKPEPTLKEAALHLWNKMPPEKPKKQSWLCHLICGKKKGDSHA